MATNIAEIKTVWGEIDPMYNPDTCCNGGGYLQASGGVLYSIDGRDLVVEINDDSCGDYGTRFSATVESGEYKWYLNWGTMDGAQDDDIDDVLDSIDGVLGIDSWSTIKNTIDNMYIVAWECYYESECA